MFESDPIAQLLPFLGISLPFIIVPILIALVDFITLLRTKFAKAVDVTQAPPTEEDFSILIPIFGHMRYLKNVDYLKDYGNRVILCTTTHESDKFNQKITAIAKKYGFRIFRSEVALASRKHTPNPWRLFHRALHGVERQVVSDVARDEIIRDSFAATTSKYCIFLDGDTVSAEPLNKLVGLFVKEKFDIASVRVLASQQKTLAEKLQAIEYELAMDARRVYPWLTSGASMVARTSVIKDIMQHHSLFFSGGDIEIGKLAKLLGHHVGHIAFVFYTDVPATFKAWFKQRIAWFGGGFRHAVINIHSYTWRHPFFFLYTTFIVYLLTPVRWYEAVMHPWVIPIVIVIYWVLLYAFHWQYRRWTFILFPIYALVQVMLIVPCGMVKYFSMALRAKNIGLIRLRHKKIKGATEAIIETS